MKICALLFTFVNLESKEKQHMFRSYILKAMKNKLTGWMIKQIIFHLSSCLVDLIICLCVWHQQIIIDCSLLKNHDILLNVIQ